MKHAHRSHARKKYMEKEALIEEKIRAS